MSGFLAILPLFGSWLIWLPASLYLAFDDRWSEAVSSSSLQLTFSLLHIAAGWFDSFIYQLIPGANSYFIGMSIVLGVSTFGAVGIILGPLLVGTLVPVKEIYLAWVAEDNPKPRASLSRRDSFIQSLSSPLAQLFARATLPSGFDSPAKTSSRSFERSLNPFGAD